MNELQPYRILAFAALTISVRILTWTTVLVGSGIFIYAVIDPNQTRTIAAATYAILIFLPSIFVEKRRQPVRPQQQPENEAQYG